MLTTTNFLITALIFMATVQMAVSERRYCGPALIERVIEVCSQTDCGTVDEIRELEISLVCCRRRCTSEQIKSYCCYNNYPGTKGLKETLGLEKTPFRPSLIGMENF